MKIRYCGSCGHRSGYAHAANEMALALLSAGADLEIRVLGPEGPVFEGPTLPLAKCVRTDAELSVNPDVVIVHTTPTDCGVYLDGIDLPYGAFKVAYTTWEGSSAMPETFFGSRLGKFDQVWVPSQTNWRYMQYPKGNVFVMPHAYDEAQLESRRRPRQAAPKRLRFYYLGAWTGRKNPAGVIQAWARAFTADDPVELHIYSAETEQMTFVLSAHMTGISPDEMAPIYFHNEELTDEEVLQVHRENDVFVTASRGEGFNLPAFEAVLAGRGVISTWGLGSDDFLDGYAGAQLVIANRQPSCNDVKIGGQVPGEPEGTYRLLYLGSDGVNARIDWLDPDLLRFASALRNTADYHKTLSTRRVYDLPPRFYEKFERKAVGERAMKALEKGMAARG